ncbi:MAG: P1 family peptidase, partial [Chloroflexi bacterium]|nr:P1 family peptidase [Chloroflexota bacterium]
MSDTITDVPGIKVGHYTDTLGITGCTVVLCEEGAVAGVDVRGSAPGTRETDLLRPMNLVEKAHAILLSGGSAYGLSAADGVMRYLEERGAGFDVGVGVVPIVPAAILFDLGLGDARARPGPEQGYQACLNAQDNDPEQGSVGAGTGATVGKALGPRWAVKGGVGCASASLGGSVTVGALAVVNAWGSVVDHDSGQIVAGPRKDKAPGFQDTVALLASGIEVSVSILQNTTLTIVATDAALSKEQVNKIAQMAQDGIAMAVRPAHTMYDGDAVFVLSTGRGKRFADTTALGAVAAAVMNISIVRGVTRAKG